MFHVDTFQLLAQKYPGWLQEDFGMVVPALRIVCHHATLLAGRDQLSPVLVYLGESGGYIFFGPEEKTEKDDETLRAIIIHGHEPYVLRKYASGRGRLEYLRASGSGTEADLENDHIGISSAVRPLLRDKIHFLESAR